MAKKSPLDAAKATTNALINKAKSQPGGTYSSSSSVSNSGQMSTQTSTTGATGAQVNTTTIRVAGDPGFSLGQDSDVIKGYRSMMGL